MYYYHLSFQNFVESNLFEAHFKFRHKIDNITELSSLSRKLFITYKHKFHEKDTSPSRLTYFKFHAVSNVIQTLN